MSGIKRLSLCSVAAFVGHMATADMATAQVPVALEPETAAQMASNPLGLCGFFAGTATPRPCLPTVSAPLPFKMPVLPTVSPFANQVQTTVNAITALPSIIPPR